MQKPAQAREPYERPRVVKVVIVAEEMAVTGCKTVSSRDGPIAGCFYTDCRQTGS